MEQFHIESSIRRKAFVVPTAIQLGIDFSSLSLLAKKTSNRHYLSFNDQIGIKIILQLIKNCISSNFQKI